MKSFSCYIQDEILYEEVSEELEKRLNELNIQKAVTSVFRKTVLSPMFKQAVVLWKKRIAKNEDPVQAATEVAKETNKLNPREFVDFLKTMKLIEV